MKALITGITGQDGSYLAELLLSKGYEVHGIIRRASTLNTGRIDHILDKIQLHYGDLSDASLIDKLINTLQPDEVYNLGAQSHVQVSFEIPLYTSDVVGLGTLRLLEAIKNFSPQTKFYQASSSEMFGKNTDIPQSETTIFHPASPYGCAKLYAYWITRNYRESYHLFTCNGILFNHESPRRGEHFVTRKITKFIGRFLKGEEKKLYLGNMNAKRDWGFSGDYVEAMWLMLQGSPDDYVISTGETHSVREFIEEAFKVIGKEIVWKGEGLDEKGYINGECVVEISEKYFRKNEVDILLGNSNKAKKLLGWNPKTSFKELVKLMVNSDL